MEILQQIWKSRKWIASTLLTFVNIIANVIDIKDSLSKLTGLDWLFGRPEYIDYFVLYAAIFGLIYNWLKATNYKTRNDELSDESADD